MKDKISVSIVEDNIEKLEELKEAIENAADMILISIYNNTADALKNLPMDNPEFVLMDIGFDNSKMDGVECMFKVKLINPIISFLMFTVFVTSEKLFDALKYGADGYILKREGATGVLNALRKITKGDFPTSPEITQKIKDSFRAGSACIQKLTPKEGEILNLVAKGLLNKEIADIQNITEGSVKAHLSNIFPKLHVNNRAEAILKYLGRL